MDKPGPPGAPAFVSVAPFAAAPPAEVPSDAEAPAFFTPPPAAPAPPPAAPAPPPAAAPAPTAAAEPSGDSRPAVLVVEDNSDTRLLLDRILRTPYRVTAVGEARAALLQMNAQRFDALVLDINLGGKETGADVLRIARALPGYERVFAIALTAYALPGDRERLLEAGFDEYISKPFTRHALLEALAAGLQAKADLQGKADAAGAPPALAHAAAG
ncbi:MAG: response regulator [Rubricoccaceae bacterium]